MNRLRALVWTALGSGLAAGLTLTALQWFWIAPLIAEAERYEQGQISAHRNVPGSSDQSSPALAPAPAPALSPAPAPNPGAAQEPARPGPDWARRGWTLAGNLIAGVGFGLLLAAAFSLWRGPMDAARGLLWGWGGYAAFMLAPSLGLPPEAPGMAAAEVGPRQLWWLATAALTACGLAVLALAPLRVKALGLVLLAAPHGIGAPHPPPGAEEILPAALAGQYAAAVISVNGAFWAVLGAASGWIYRRVS